MEDKIIIECERCGCCNTVYKQDMDFEVITYEKSENQMGSENEHYTSHEISCEKCGDNISIDYSAWEYPAGCFETSNIDISGGKVVDFFDETAMFQEKYYDFDEEIGIYLPQQQQRIISDLNVGIANLILSAKKDPSLINNIKPREFEAFIADLFKRKGFNVELTKQTRDGGCDIIAVRSDLDIKIKFIIECKRYAQGNTIGVDIVRQLYGVQQAIGANKSVLVTTSRFSKDAIDFASTQTTEWHMSLIDFKQLLSWVEDEYGYMPLF